MAGLGLLAALVAFAQVETRAERAAGWATPSDATAPAASTPQQLHGCWDWQPLNMKKILRRICLAADQTGSSLVVERGDGWDSRFRWAWQPGGFILLDNDRCRVTDLKDGTLHLADCAAAGVWLRACVERTDAGDGCRVK